MSSVVKKAVNLVCALVLAIPGFAAFALRLAHKDMSLATQLGRDFNVPMRIANLALADLSEALNRGWGDRDSTSPWELQEEKALLDATFKLQALDSMQKTVDALSGEVVKAQSYLQRAHNTPATPVVGPGGRSELALTSPASRS